MAMLARDVMQSKVITVEPDMALDEVAELLCRERISGAPVIEDGEVIGVVSRSDLVRLPLVGNALAELVDSYERDLAEARGEPDARYVSTTVGEQLSGRTARDAMTANAVSVTPDTPIVEVAKKLNQLHMHRVLVEEDGELKGMITSLDLVRLISDGKFVPV